jgi:hypothetical protein
MSPNFRPWWTLDEMPHSIQNPPVIVDLSALLSVRNLGQAFSYVPLVWTFWRTSKGSCHAGRVGSSSMLGSTMRLWSGRWRYSFHIRISWTLWRESSTSATSPKGSKP